MKKRDLLNRIKQLERRVADLEAIAAARPAEPEPMPWLPVVPYWPWRDTSITWTVTDGTVQGPPRIVPGTEQTAVPDYKQVLDSLAHCRCTVAPRATPTARPLDDLEY